MKVKSIVVTPMAEATMAYIARVSNPSNQDNPNIASLLRFCLRQGHWSVFEHGFWTVEIEAPVFVTRQLLRHRSFSFSEFSQRYASPAALGMAPVQLRRRALKNRQGSGESLSDSALRAWSGEIGRVTEEALFLYGRMLEEGIAPECARYVLPMGIMSRMYMTGSVRSWIHFLQVRTQEDVQKETRDVALAIRALFVDLFPICAHALGWTADDQVYGAAD